MLAPPPPAIARASSSCRGLLGESPTPGKSGPRFAYGAGSSFFSHQPEQPRCIDALICSIKPPSDLNKKASTFLAEGDNPGHMDKKKLYYEYSFDYNMQILPLENMEERLTALFAGTEFAHLVDLADKAKYIYLIGNGGLHYVASHMSTDISRLLKDKYAYSFDSVGFITSSANDYGYNDLFAHWLSHICPTSTMPETLVIGLSCSGTSLNIAKGLQVVRQLGGSTFLISGLQPSSAFDEFSSINFNFQYFHTVETACMILFYQLIHSLGSCCPSIASEVQRCDTLETRVSN